MLSRAALTQTNDARIIGAKSEIEARRKQLEAFHELCSELGEYEDNVALAWILANDAITAPIVGPASAEHLEGALKALEISLSDDVMKRLDEIFPGPGGMAPEAYAW
jgi:aryl-alcohol dehydrogenase-like predicted oxidoreductase